MRSIVLLCALAILSGCADSTFDAWKTKAAANQDAEDDAKCQSSGGKPDDPAYVARSSMRHARKRRRGPTNSRESVQGIQHFRRVSLESTTERGRRIRAS